MYGHAPICPLHERDYGIGVCVGCAPGMNRVHSGYDSGMHRGKDQVITLSVELGAGGFGARPRGRFSHTGAPNP